jgi:hypothetical protein
LADFKHPQAVQSAKTAFARILFHGTERPLVEPFRR